MRYLLIALAIVLFSCTEESNPTNKNNQTQSTEYPPNINGLWVTQQQVASPDLKYFEIISTKDSIKMRYGTTPERVKLSDWGSRKADWEVLGEYGKEATYKENNFEITYAINKHLDEIYLFQNTYFRAD